jgi:short-subunit dehydrogenase
MAKRHIVITGASGGLGRALALHYSSLQNRLALYGRDEARLKEAARACENAGAEVQPVLADVTDAQAMRDSLTALDKSYPIDLLIVNAGISAGTGGSGESEEQARRIFAVNLDGALNTIYPVLPRMQARRAGQIAIISSVAGFRGLPSCPAYSASKAAVRAYGEALRGFLLGSGVKVNVVCPGYIKTPMTDVNQFPMPFIMSAEKAARIIAAGLARDEARIAFPFPIYFGVWLLQALPPSMTDWLLARLPAKGGGV